MTSQLPKDFYFEIILGGITEEQLDGEQANITIKGIIPKTNISSFNSLKDKTKEMLADALSIISQKDDLDAIDIYYESVPKGNESPKSIRTGSELCKFLMFPIKSLSLTVLIRDEMMESAYSEQSMSQ